MITKFVLYTAVLFAVLLGMWIAQRATMQRNERRKHIHKELMRLDAIRRERGLAYDELDEMRELYEELEALQ